MQVKVAGILGGMGPRATVDFMSKVLEQTPVESEQDHLRLLIDHNPQTPNRHAAIDNDRAGVGLHLANMARGLERAGADFLAMPCNTAHAFQGQIQAAVSIPLVSILDEVVAELQQHWPAKTNIGKTIIGKAKIGVMAATGCLQAQLYQRALRQAGYQPVLWDASQLEDFMSLLYRIKAGDDSAEVRQRCSRLAEVLVQNGAQVLLAGCTEIPLVLERQTLSVPLVDSTDVLVASVIAYSLGEKPLPANAADV